MVVVIVYGLRNGVQIRCEAAARDANCQQQNGK